jgi:3-oxoacyl-(acyl-carrier-protein) synthase
MEARNIRRLGSSAAEKLMCSGISARIAGVLGLGGAVTTNSSACATGTEAVIDAYHKLRRGMGLRYLVGAAENASPYSWAPFDALRVLTRGFNDTPERASRPLSASSTGFVPAGGAGVLMLESLESALQRGARIYAEVTGGAVNCGGQRQGGSMTARNNGSARRCIETATAEAGITGADVDLISGHLTGTRADVDEVSLWMESLGLTPESMPLINSPISLTGHLLGAAGSVGCIAAVLQIHKSFVHPSANCEDLLSSLEPFRASIPHTAVKRHVETVCKASFGFGDVNACVVFRKWSSPN